MLLHRRLFAFSLLSAIIMLARCSIRYLSAAILNQCLYTCKSCCSVYPCCCFPFVSLFECSWQCKCMFKGCSRCYFTILVSNVDGLRLLEDIKIDCNCFHYHNYLRHSNASLAVMICKTITFQTLFPVIGSLIQYTFYYCNSFYNNSINSSKATLSDL